MKPFKSIKWRLQLWYGLILVTVLAGFGITAYQLERNRIFRRVDEEIHRRLAMLMQSTHRRPDRPGLGPETDALPPGFPADRRGPDFDHGPGFDLPPQLAAMFGTNSQGNFFFRVSMVREDGVQEIARSDNYRPVAIPVPAVNRPLEPVDHPGDPRAKPPPPPLPFDVGTDRMAQNDLPSGEHIEVGCSVAPELHELKLAAANLTAIGGFILLVGLVGGGWFVGRALRPIADISATASKISAGDLAQRINTAEADSELGQLTAVLNSTFARLETAFAQQQQFAADAAHELRTPVTVILTQTQTALNRERDAASYRQTLEACQRAAQRMRKLIESLLELARFDAGQENLKRQPLDLAQTAAEGVEMVRPLAAESRVKLVTSLAPLIITGDPDRLTQVIVNLLTNAIQFTRPDGEIRLALAAQNGLAVLVITDTGTGIDPEDLPHIFRRFYRADKARTGSGNSGLGLSICKAIIEAHGGAIEAASTSGAGTTFTLKLPLSA
jgi:heavy metal sensor kinase